MPTDHDFTVQYVDFQQWEGNQSANNQNSTNHGIGLIRTLGVILSGLALFSALVEAPISLPEMDSKLFHCHENLL